MIDNVLFECPDCKGLHFNITKSGALQCTTLTCPSVMKPPKLGCGWTGRLPNEKLFDLAIELSQVRSLIREANKIKVEVKLDNFKEIRDIFINYADTIRAAIEEGEEDE